MIATDAEIEYPLVCPTLPDPSEVFDGVRGVIVSGRVTTGENVAALEADVRAVTGVRHAIAVSSGTSALMLLIRALGLPEDSEVIVPSFTFAATAHALLWNRLRPVFCDSEPESFTLDAACAESLITENTSAIYPVCIFGVPGDLDAYQSLAERHGLALIYDSAQGLGSAYRGTPLGGFGAAEAFSMSPTKVVTALEGGLVTTNRDSLADRIRCMRDYGKAPDGEDMNWLGLSARMTEINAIIGRWSLERMPMWIANRSAIMRRYRERLSDLPGVSFQSIPRWCSSSRNYFVVLIDPERSPVTRDDLKIQLTRRGVQTKRYFYPALHDQTLYRGLHSAGAGRLPIAERISHRSLALPMYSHMPLDAVDVVCDRIEQCFKFQDSGQKTP